MSKGFGKLCNKRVLWKLVYLKKSLDEIKDATWLSNAYMTNTKEILS